MGPICSLAFIFITAILLFMLTVELLWVCGLRLIVIKLVVANYHLTDDKRHIIIINNYKSLTFVLSHLFHISIPNTILISLHDSYFMRRFFHPVLKLSKLFHDFGN